MSKGYAIISMLLLHLFCLRGNEVLGAPLIWIDSETPLIYYLGWLCAICVPTYCLCSGYAHYRQGEIGGLSLRRNLKRCLKFLVIFWTCCICVAICGLFLNPTGIIPGDIKTFLLNFFLLKWSYTGIWWYALIYIIYVLVSPVFYKISRRCNTLILLIILLIQFLAIEALYKKDCAIFTLNPMIGYLWTRIYYLLGARLLGYMTGMIIAKENIFTSLNSQLSRFTSKVRNFILLVSLFLISVVILVINRGILVVLLALPVFIIYNSLVKSKMIKKIFSFLGAQSTFIWFIHPFIYNGSFPLISDLLLNVRYPLLIFMLLLAVCCVLSVGLSKVTAPIIREIANK